MKDLKWLNYSFFILSWILRTSKVDYSMPRCNNTKQEIRIIINKQLFLSNSN